MHRYCPCHATVIASDRAHFLFGLLRAFVKFFFGNRAASLPRRAPCASSSPSPFLPPPAREEAPTGMVHITGAQFVMGAEPDSQKLRDDLEQQGVEVQELWLDATAVTNEAFRGFRKATGYSLSVGKP